MKQIRIRSITNGKSSPWVYIQEQTRKAAPEKASVFQAKAVPEAEKSRTNQYGRFRYNELQYGKIERLILSSIEISKTPVRIKNIDGDWVYIQQTSFTGASPSIRIRQRYGDVQGPWIYIQNEEV